MLRLRSSAYPLLLFLVSCLGEREFRAVPQPEFRIPHGQYQTFPSPRSGMEPGQIVRVDRLGRMFEVTTVAGVNPRPEDYPLPSVNWKGTSKLGAFLGALDEGAGLASEILPENGPSFGFEGGSETEIEFVFHAEGGLREHLTDKGLSKALNAALEEIREDLDPDATYFLIRDTIAVTELSYQLDRQAAAKLGGRGSLEALVGGQYDVSEDSQESVTIRRTFPKPMRILYQMEPVEVLLEPDRTAQERRQEALESRRAAVRQSLQLVVDAAGTGFTGITGEGHSNTKSGRPAHRSSVSVFETKPALVLLGGIRADSGEKLSWPFADPEDRLTARTWFTAETFPDYSSLEQEFRIQADVLRACAKWDSRRTVYSEGNLDLCFEAFVEPGQSWSPAVRLSATTKNGTYRLYTRVHANLLKKP